MRNKSFTYVLPLFSSYFDIVKQNLLNTYLYNEDYPDLKNHLFFLYRFSGDLVFIEYEDYLKTQKLFEVAYDPDKYHVMYAFKIPSLYQGIYDKFIKGKYSKFSDDYKIQLFKFHAITDPDHRVAQVLFRHPDLREEWEEKLDVSISEEAEVSSPPDEKMETYSKELKYKDPMKTHFENIKNKFK
ncbi:MAG: hypothetical protein CMG00_08065 [Candidatus Marinimicrobia bacterium]|nr:hypothetical protein [Candidatus Neomarinimicrobiota bacterium]